MRCPNMYLLKYHNEKLDFELKHTKFKMSIEKKLNTGIRHITYVCTYLHAYIGGQTKALQLFNLFFPE
jgi:hypothetical protein